MTTLTTHPEPLNEPAAETPAQQLADVAARSGMTPDDLGELLSAFTEVTDRLGRTHETLRSEVVRLQSELSSANAQLRRAQELAALGEMAAGIAHEIRNPLGSIRLYANILEEDLCDRPPEREIACKIASAVRGLDHIVSDVLDFARELRVRPAMSDAATLFERAIDACHDRIVSSGAGIGLAETADSGDLECDPDLLHQALTNLIRNAADAVADNEDGRPRRISLGFMSSGDTLELVVEDTGPGMPEEVRQRMFNPFFTTRHAGTGLGLAIVHRIIDAHGGRIQVSNIPAGGARIAVVMPVHHQAQPQS
jgi:signal transduction histidine kinase